MRFLCHLLSIAAVCGLLAAAPGAAQVIPAGEKPAVPAQAPPARPVEEFRIIPVRVHLLRHESSKVVGTTLTAADVERVIRKANGIWNAAGLHLWVESVIEEKPAEVRPFFGEVVPLTLLKGLRPEESRAAEMFHVYYVGALDVNGIYMGAPDAIFVQQGAKLQPVEGGIDEPLPRVTSHELGHGLGLPHRQFRVNLMASGTTGTKLNKEEIQIARHTAYRLPWILPAEEFLKKAEELTKAGKAKEASGMYRALAELPGDSPLKRRAAEALKPKPKPARR